MVRIPVSGLGGIGDALAGSRIDCALGSAGATGQSEVLRGLEEAPAEGGTNGGSEYLTGLTLLPAILMLVLLVVLLGWAIVVCSLPVIVVAVLLAAALLTRAGLLGERLSDGGRFVGSQLLVEPVVAGVELGRALVVGEEPPEVFNRRRSTAALMVSFLSCFHRRRSAEFGRRRRLKSLEAMLDGLGLRREAKPSNTCTRPFDAGGALPGPSGLPLPWLLPVGLSCCHGDGTAAPRVNGEAMEGVPKGSKPLLSPSCDSQGSGTRWGIRWLTGEIPVVAARKPGGTQVGLGPAIAGPALPPVSTVNVEKGTC